MKQNTLRLMLFILVTTSIGIGFFIHHLDEIARNKTLLLQTKLAAEIKEEHARKLQNALDRAQKSVVSIDASPAPIQGNKGRTEVALQNGRPVHLGSGIIVSPSGVILTLADVVSGTSKVRVETLDKQEYLGDVMATDDVTGLALVKINAQGLPIASFGDPSKNDQGDPVFALSFVQNSNLTMKLGVVAGRPIPPSDDRYVPFIQSDLSLSPSWSGGALVNYEGEIIGINAPNRDLNDSKETGLSFALPIDVALALESTLISDGVIQRGRLGISVQPLNLTLANALGLTSVKGALVSWVDQEGPGGEAGLLAGDTILKIAQYEVSQAEDLPPLVASFKPETVANLTVLRNKKALDLPIKIGAQIDVSKSPKLASAPATEAISEFGLSLSSPKAGSLKRIGLASGMIAKSVSSAALASGILTGDIILGINGEPLNSQEDFNRIQSPDTRDFAVQIYRDGHIFFVGVHISPANQKRP